MAQFLSHLSAGSEVYRGHLLYDLSGGEKSSATGRKLFTHAGAKTEKIKAEMGWEGKEERGIWTGLTGLEGASLFLLDPQMSGDWQRIVCVTRGESCLRAAFQQCDEGGEAADEDRGFGDAEEVDDPGDANAEGSPLEPPLVGRGHEVDDEQECHDKRTDE